MPQFPERPTHYAYLSCPLPPYRQPTGLIDLPDEFQRIRLYLIGELLDIIRTGQRVNCICNS